MMCRGIGVLPVDAKLSGAATYHIEDGKLRMPYLSIAGCGSNAAFKLKEMCIRDSCAGINKPIKVAVMGCVVNGPGEAREADIGIAGGNGEGILFKKGQILDVYKRQGISSFRRITYALCLPASSQPRFPTRAECSFLTFRTAAGLTKS